MEKIIEFLTHILENRNADNPSGQEETEWVQHYLDTSQEIIPELLETSNKLGIDTLTSFLTKILAESIAGKTPGEIRSMLDLPSDFDSSDMIDISAFAYLSSFL